MPLIGAFIVPHPPLIVPAIGKGQQKQIQKTIDAYEEVASRIAKLKPETIVVITPHSVVYSDYFHISPGEHAKGDFRDFGAPDVHIEVNYDNQFVQNILVETKREGISAGTRGERNKALDHATMVPLHFVNQYYREYKLVRISPSGFSPLIHYRFGKCIAKAAQKDERVLIIASGDLSHKLKADGPYGLAKEGAAFDREVTQAMASGDFLRFLTFDENFCEAAAECGLRSFLIMAGALDRKSVTSELLSYEGPFGVGYAVAAFSIVDQDNSRHFDNILEQTEAARISALKAREDDYVRLARQSLEHYVKMHKRILRAEVYSDELINQRAGVFVSLKMEGRLRGCIGTISPTTACIADEIIQNAVSAGVEDTRFEPVRTSELPFITISVDVLGEAEPIASLDALNAARYGVIVTSKGRRGLLLPNLEGIDTPEQQVHIALNKAGISPNEHYAMERFEVVRHT